METLALILTAVSCTAAAVWTIKNGLNGIEKAVAVHVAQDEMVHKDFEARVLKLERRKR